MWMHFILIVFYSPAAGMCAFGSRLNDQTFNQWHLSKCDRLLDGWKERYVLDREGLKSETHSRNPLLSLSLTEFFWKGCMGGTSGLFGDGVTFSRSWLVKWLSYRFRQTSLLACLYNVKLQSQSHCTFLPFNQLPFSVSIMQVIRCWTSAWYELKTWQCKCVFFPAWQSITLFPPLTPPPIPRCHPFPPSPQLLPHHYLIPDRLPTIQCPCVTPAHHHHMLHMNKYWYLTIVSKDVFQNIVFFLSIDMFYGHWPRTLFFLK